MTRRKVKSSCKKVRIEEKIVRGTVERHSLLRVWGLVFGVFRVWGSVLVFEVREEGFRSQVSGLGWCLVESGWSGQCLGVGVREYGFGEQVSGLGSWMSGVRCKVQGYRCRE